jgi:hypothetical protein
MTSARFLWVVVAGRGHSSEPRGLTEDLGRRESESRRVCRAASSQGADRLVRRRLGPGSADRHRGRPEAPNRSSGGSACTSSTGAIDAASASC